MQPVGHVQANSPWHCVSIVVLLILTTGWLCLPAPVKAQLPQPYLVKDSNTRTLGADPIGFTGVNGIVYFAANDGIHGSELWRSDGTAAGTWLVKDLWPGWQGSSPRTFQVAPAGAFYFLTRSPEGNKNSIWRSDGTTAGTQEVLRDYVDWFLVLNGDVYFARWSLEWGTELWKTDGAPGGAKLVKDIYPGAESSHIHCVLQFKETLYCSADDGVHGRELWRTDGTEQGTYLVKEIDPANQPQQIEVSQNKAAINQTSTVDPANDNATTEQTTILGYGEFIVQDERFYFAAYQPTSGRELWQSDGTAEGTVLVQDLLPGPESSRPQSFIAATGFVYFTSYRDGGPSEVWRTDGTANGTQKLGEGATYAAAVLNDTLFFVGGTTTGNAELWQSDGTPAGTRLVKEIYPGPTPSGPTEMAVLNNRLYFFAQDESHGNELWTSDGTAAGTHLFKDFFPGPGNAAPAFGVTGHEPVVINGVLYFRTIDPVAGYELWKSDGTLAGTRLVKDIHNSHTESGQPSQFAAVNDTLYFMAINNLGKTALWQTNATATDAAEVFAFDDNQYLLSNSVVMSGTLYFAMMTIGGPVLVRIAGDQRIEIPLQSTQQGEINCCFYPLMVASGKLFFIAVYNLRNEAGALIRQEEVLWVSDGADSGTQLIKQLPRALFLSQRMVAFQDQLYFLAAAPEESQSLALWRSDGTTAGTVAVKSVPFVNNPAHPPYFTVAGGKLYFIALEEGDFTTKLWRSDGTTAGTESVASINISPCSNFNGLTVYQNALYFCAADPQAGAELWKSDGTATGTVLFKDINPGPADSHPQPLQLFNNQLYFAATDAIHGRELWRMEGAGEDPTLFLDLTPGANSSAIGAATGWHNQLYFMAKVAPSPQDNGLDLWRSDGTSAGTQRLAPMGLGTLEHPLVMTPRVLFFVGYTPATGNELWAINTAFDEYLFLPLTSD